VRRRITEELEEARRNARKEFAAHVDSARQAARAERERAFRELRQEVGELALLCAEAVLGEALDRDRHLKLARDAAERIARQPRRFRTRRPYAHLVTAIPMTPDEMAGVVRAMAQGFAEPVVLVPVVDPKILGGVVVAAQDAVVDGSVRGALDQVQARLG
jgi:F0F1-type ATP synthase delta subunit